MTLYLLGALVCLVACPVSFEIAFKARFPEEKVHFGYRLAWHGMSLLLAFVWPFILASAIGSFAGEWRAERFKKGEDL